MKDGIIAGTGNSRFLKSDIGANATWEEVRALLRAGTLPIDLNGLNADGWTQLPTILNKIVLLTDEVAAALGVVSSDPTLTEAFDATRYSKIIEITGDTTLSTVHCNRTLWVTAEAIITIPDGTAIPVGEEIEIYRGCADPVTLTGEAGVYAELVGASSALLLSSNPRQITQFASVVLKHIAEGYWSIQGNLTT